MPPTKRGKKRLSDDIVSDAIPEPTGHVAVQRTGVPVVEQGEQLGLMPGLLDQRGIIRAFSWWRSHR